MLMKIFETHAHLLDSAFDKDREAVITRMNYSGVVYAVEACCKADDILHIQQLCEAYPFILPTAGVHPEEINQKVDNDLLKIDKTARNTKLYAIGEIGLDYHYEDMCPKYLQKQYFDAQLSIAEQNGLPVIIHSRDAHRDCLDILKAHKGKLTGIMHCFSGSWEIAKECLDLDLHLGFGGVLTFKNARKCREVLEKMPVSRIVFETDCPYMAPEPFRGNRNEPSYIPYIINTAASIKKDDPLHLSEEVYKNSIDLFGIK